MFARDPDLAAIGRAAERWRRTVAGDWRYSGPPTGWQQAGPLDAVLAKRLDRLLDHSNPQDAAHAQLGLWSSRDPAALWPTLQRRFGKSFEAARALTDPKRRTEMLGTAIPTAFVPPVAVLLETPRGEKS